jgi:transcriptional regulator with XRE-family HTH domain
MSPRALGSTIKRLRKRQDLEQQELAAKAGVSQPYLSKLEAGRMKNPTLDVLRKLAKALGVTLEELT